MAKNLSKEYSACHWRVRQARGRAADRSCLFHAERGVEVPAREWARLHEQDGTDPAHYVSLCRPCHDRYDNITGRNRGTARSAETRAKISAAMAGRPGRTWTADEIARVKATLKADPARIGIARRAALARWGSP